MLEAVRTFNGPTALPHALTVHAEDSVAVLEDDVTLADGASVDALLAFDRVDLVVADVVVWIKDSDDALVPPRVVILSLGQIL